MDADRHRAFVREIDRRFSHTYGYGGMAVLLVLACYGYAAWQLAWYTHVWTYIVALTVVLIALRVVSVVVKRTRPVLRERVESYCQANGITPESLCAYYADDGTYPYFLALFDDPRAAEMER